MMPIFYAQKRRLSADKTDMKMLTPCSVLERMCESIIRHDTVAVMDDVQLFWGKEWDLAQVPDPREEDALKYALKACFLERMAEVWSEPPKSHPAAAPDWCRQVAAVKENFSVISPEYQNFFDGGLTSPVFSRRNIFAPRDFMFFV